MGMGGQAAQSEQKSSSEGRSRAESESASKFGSESVSGGESRSFGESSGRSASSGSSFGFSGLQPTDSASLSSAVTGDLTGTVLPSLRAAAGTTYDLPALTARGLYPAQETAARQLTEDALSKISGRLAGQGFVSPENVSNVAGSAVQNVLPQLMPVISENVRAAARAPLEVAAARTGAISPLLQNLAGLLGSQQQAQQQAASEQAARSESLATQQAIAKSFGESLSKAVSEAIQTGQSYGSSSSFGFGLGVK